MVIVDTLRSVLMRGSAGVVQESRDRTGSTRFSVATEGISGNMPAMASGLHVGPFKLDTVSRACTKPSPPAKGPSLVKLGGGGEVKLWKAFSAGKPAWISGNAPQSPRKTKTTLSIDPFSGLNQRVSEEGPWPNLN